LALRLGIVVEFRVKNGHRTRFLDLVKENARLSAEREPGCLQFDVLESGDQSNHVLLYELYCDEASFEAHVRASHFLDFDRESTPLVESKTVRRFALFSSNVHSVAGEGVSR
jgi:quinol monooxygenase YgiN